MVDSEALTAQDVAVLREHVVNILLEHKLDANEDAIIEAADDIIEEVVLGMGVETRQ